MLTLTLSLLIPFPNLPTIQEEAPKKVEAVVLETSQPKTIEFLKNVVDKKMYNVQSHGATNARLDMELNTQFGAVPVTLYWTSKPQWNYALRFDDSQLPESIRAQLSSLLREQVDPRELASMLLLSEADRGLHDYIVRHEDEGELIRVDYFGSRDQEKGILKRSQWFKPDGTKMKTLSYPPKVAQDIRHRASRVQTKNPEGQEDQLVVTKIEGTMASFEMLYKKAGEFVSVSEMVGEGPTGPVSVKYNVAYSIDIPEGIFQAKGG